MTAKDNKYKVGDWVFCVFTLQQVKEMRNSKIHIEGERLNLNHPGIHCWLLKKWCEICNHRDDTEFVTKGLKELESWSQKILARCESAKNEKIGDLLVFRV